MLLLFVILHNNRHRQRLYRLKIDGNKNLKLKFFFAFSSHFCFFSELHRFDRNFRRDLSLLCRFVEFENINKACTFSPTCLDKLWRIKDKNLDKNSFCTGFFFHLVYSHLDERRTSGWCHTCRNLKSYLSKEKTTKRKKFFFTLLFFLPTKLAQGTRNGKCHRTQQTRWLLSKFKIMKFEKKTNFFLTTSWFFKIFISVLPTGPLNGRKTGACQNYRNWTALVLFFLFFCSLSIYA